MIIFLSPFNFLIFDSAVFLGQILRNEISAIIWLGNGYLNGNKMHIPPRKMAISKTWRSYVSRYRIKHKIKQYVLFVPSIRKKNIADYPYNWQLPRLPLTNTVFFCCITRERCLWRGLKMDNLNNRNHHTYHLIPPSSIQNILHVHLHPFIIRFRAGIGPFSETVSLRVEPSLLYIPALDHHPAGGAAGGLR